ncbi:hypothetical protein ACC806_34790 [Rhizobium ruizarguesonis]
MRQRLDAIYAAVISCYTDERASRFCLIVKITAIFAAFAFVVAVMVLA